MESSGAVALSSSNALHILSDKASQRKLADLAYAGEVSPVEVFEYVKENPSVVVDVRTAPEWQFVGVPDLSSTPSQLLTISWKLYPSFALNPRFLNDLTSEAHIKRETPLFFLCRSGGRSLDAAVAMTSKGYDYCFNITGGFEGDVDGAGHRASTQGWKYEQLPWMQG